MCSPALPPFTEKRKARTIGKPNAVYVTGGETSQRGSDPKPKPDPTRSSGK